MNDTFDRSWPLKMLVFSCLITWMMHLNPEHHDACAQPPVQPIEVYPDSGQIQQVRLPARPQYYEYLPRGNDWDRSPDTPLEVFLKQVAQQSYFRVDYLHWSISDPSQTHIGAPGKRLGENIGFAEPAFIDMTRAAGLDDNDVISGDVDAEYPIRNPLLYPNPDDLVLIQVWDSSQEDLFDANADLFEYEFRDLLPLNAIDGVADTIDDNDLDIFPRLTNTQKLDFFGNRFDPAATSTLVTPTTDSTVDPGFLPQVAVLTVGRLANTRAFQLDDNNGFRGVWGVNTTFGAMEMSFFTVGSSLSGFEYVPLPNFLLGVSNTGGGTPDPLVIPILVNDQMAPDVYDDNNNLVTDSNNYYLVFNDTYRATFESESWGLSPSVFWTLRERPDRFRISGSLGFQYFDLREQFYQRGTFSQTATDPNRPFYIYENELADGDATIPDTALLTSTIDSVTSNMVMGPTVGIRTEVGDEQFSFGLDTKLMLGANTYEAEVGVDDLLFEGDDNFTSVGSTDFSAGFEAILDARVRIQDHVTLTAGYNFLWFSGITRPDENVYYNVDATLIPLTSRGPVAVNAPNTGPDYLIQNDVVVKKEETTFSLSGLSVGVEIDW